MTRRSLAVAVAAALCGLVAAPALGQNAPAATAAPTKLKPKARDGRVHRHGDGDELPQGRSGRAAGGRDRLGKLEEGARRAEDRQTGPSQIAAEVQLPGGSARDFRRRTVDGCDRRRCLRPKDAQPDGLNAKSALQAGGRAGRSYFSPKSSAT